jgi:hypothetical protein
MAYSVVSQHPNGSYFCEDQEASLSSAIFVAMARASLSRLKYFVVDGQGALVRIIWFH